MGISPLAILSFLSGTSHISYQIGTGVFCYTSKSDFPIPLQEGASACRFLSRPLVEIPGKMKLTSVAATEDGVRAGAPPFQDL